MSRTNKVIYFLILMVGSSWAQKATLTPGALVENGALHRPAIFQRNLPTVEASATPSGAQLSRASFRMASNDEVNGMEQTLGGYVTAFENLNLAAMQQVWPDLDRQHATAFKDLFASFKGASATPHVVLQCGVPQVTLDKANTECRETIAYQTGKGKGKTKELGPVGVSIQLKGESGNWVISDMKGSN